jgi:hypothetical protein
MYTLLSSAQRDVGSRVHTPADFILTENTGQYSNFRHNAEEKIC